MKNAFYDPVTSVLKCVGYVNRNDEGDVLVEVDEDFSHEPGRSRWNGSQFEPYDPPAPIPKVVTMRQARLALLGAGLLDQVEAAIAGMAGTEGAAARIEWEYAATLERNWPLVNALAAQLELDDSALNALFVEAAQL